MEALSKLVVRKIEFSCKFEMFFPLLPKCIKGMINVILEVELSSVSLMVLTRLLC